MIDSHHSPELGFGLGLRPRYYEELLGERHRAVDWLEAVTENYLGLGGRPKHYLARLRDHYPIVLHGVSLSIGGSDPLDVAYLRELKSLAEWLETPIEDLAKQVEENFSRLFGGLLAQPR